MPNKDGGAPSCSGKQESSRPIRRPARLVLSWAALAVVAVGHPIRKRVRLSILLLRRVSDICCNTVVVRSHPLPMGPEAEQPYLWNSHIQRGAILGWRESLKLRCGFRECWTTRRLIQPPATETSAENILESFAEFERELMKVSDQRKRGKGKAERSETWKEACAVSVSRRGSPTTPADGETLTLLGLW